MRSVRVALALAATLTAIAVALTLRGSPTSVAATNGVHEGAEVATTTRATTGCQSGETVPAGTSAIRISLGAEIGPKVTVTARSGKHTITRGVRDGGWTGATVTVPVRSVPHTASAAQLCFALGPPLEVTEIFGTRTSGVGTLVGPTGERLPGRLGVEYLRAGTSSWLSLLPSVAQHMGLGHAWGGAWIVFALAAAMACTAALMGWLALRELRPEEPR